jgi:hypothetical protein
MKINKIINFLKNFIKKNNIKNRGIINIFKKIYFFSSLRIIFLFEFNFLNLNIFFKKNKSFSILIEKSF